MRRILALSALGLLMAGCASVPSAPTVTVMPAPNKPFEVFQEDNAVCRYYADKEVRGLPTPSDAATARALGGAALGAAAGALLGQSGEAAAIGAGAGLLLGAADTDDDWDRPRYGLQRRYDIAYQQCMYSKGNQIPGYAVQSYAPPPRRRKQ